MKKLITVTLYALSCHMLSAQNLSVGTVALEEFYRRQQLLGRVDSTISFTIRPTTVNSDSLNRGLSVLEGSKVNVTVLSPQVSLHWNSHNPYPNNDGPITPAKGVQSLSRIGVQVSGDFFSFRLQPEFVASENLAYEGFPDTLSNITWQRRYVWWNRSDTPERIGDTGTTKLLPGQSHALLKWRGLAAGISTENLWWGPGKRNSLLMSNNARGFTHLTFRTNKPMATTIGTFEGNIVAGRLEGSGAAPPEKTGVAPQFNPRNEDWRYLSAITVTYQPKWIQGLTLGSIRAVQQYSELARESKDYLPVFQNLFRENDDQNRQELEIDQLISLFFRWLWQKEQAEVYFEFGRNDAALNGRDFLLGPQHSRAYIFGITKLFDLKKPGKQLEIAYEHTQMSQSANYLIRNAGSWYLHSRVRHGYTNVGEIMGASIGPGSNMDHFSIALVEGTTKYGFRFERVANNLDFFYSAYQDSQDWRRFWIDYHIGIDAIRQHGNFLFEGSLIFTRSLNYQWELYSNPPGQPYFVSGRDVSNWFLSFGVYYIL